MKANNTGAARVRADFADDAFDEDEFDVDQLQNDISIYRYVLGLKPMTTNTSGNKVALTDISAGDLTFLANWAAGKRGAGISFTVKE